VPQRTPKIFPSLSVEENLTVAGRKGRWTLQRVYGLFPRLAERPLAPGQQISGGEQQMLAIGRALMGNPSLLLMDEPLEGLAPIIVEGLRQALQRLIAEDSLAIVLVEQSARVALEMTENVVVLDRGRVRLFGTQPVLLDDPERLAALYVATRCKSSREGKPSSGEAIRRTAYCDFFGVLSGLLLGSTGWTRAGVARLCRSKGELGLDGELLEPDEDAEPDGEDGSELLDSRTTRSKSGRASRRGRSHSCHNRYRPLTATRWEEGLRLTS